MASCPGSASHSSPPWNADELDRQAIGGLLRLRGRAVGLEPALRRFQRRTKFFLGQPLQTLVGGKSRQTLLRRQVLSEFLWREFLEQFVDTLADKFLEFVRHLRILVVRDEKLIQQRACLRRTRPVVLLGVAKQLLLGAEQ